MASIQSKYYCNSSRKIRVFDHGKLKGECLQISGTLIDIRKQQCGRRTENANNSPYTTSKFQRRTWRCQPQRAPRQASPGDTFLELFMVVNHIFSWNFNAICHSCRDKQFDFDSHIAISGCRVGRR